MFHALAAAVLVSSTPLAPQRLYYQVNGPMPLSVEAGEGRELVLLAPDNKEIARAAVPDGVGELDAASLIPNLYSFTTVHYLQLVDNSAPIGAAIVLQPLVRVRNPVLRYTERGPFVETWIEQSEQEKNMAGFRVYVERDAVLHTTHGDIRLVMRPEHAPNTVWNFLHLVEGGFYTRIPFHRVVGTSSGGPGFVIQAGDPTGNGSGGPGYRIDLEASTLPHDLGVISMAREGNDIHTAGSQFFLCLSREATARLDVQYTTFGQTIEGVEVVKKIGGLRVGSQDRPIEMPYIETAELVPAEPRTPGQAPKWIAPAPAAPAEKPAAPANPQR